MKINDLRDKVQMIKDTKKVIKKTIGLIYHFRKCYLLIMGVKAIWSGMMPAMLLLLLQQILNYIQNGNGGMEKCFEMVAIYIFLTCFNNFLIQRITLYENIFQKEFCKYTDMIFMNKVLELELKEYENKEIYNKINQAQLQNGTGILNYFRLIYQCVASFMALLSAIIIMGRYSYWIAIGIMVLPIIECIISITFRKKQYCLIVNRTERERTCWYMNFLAIQGTAFKEIRLNNLKSYILEKYEELKKISISEDVKLTRQAFTYDVLIDFFENLVFGCILIRLVYLGFIKKILIGEINTYISCIQQIQQQTETIIQQAGDGFQNTLYLKLLFEFLDLKPRRKIKEGIQINKISKVEVRHLFYRYGKNACYALKDVNLILEPGKTIGLIGRNGSGKTTLIKILLGLYTDYEGEVLINGTNLKEINLESYMGRVGCVFQDFVKYETSLHENVSYGNLKIHNNKDRIRDILHSVKLEYEQIGLNLESVLGHWFGTTQVSGGQWQKIAIARTIAKNADIYYFDEPDAALDIQSKGELVDMYVRLLEHNMGMYISHDVKGIHNICNYIVLLENGEIIEEGTHEELIKLKKEYYKRVMWKVEKGRNNDE